MYIVLCLRIEKNSVIDPLLVYPSFACLNKNHPKLLNIYFSNCISLYTGCFFMTRPGHFASHFITGATLTISFGRKVSENMQIAYSFFNVRDLLIRYFFNLLKILVVFSEGMNYVPLFHIPLNEL